MGSQGRYVPQRFTKRLLSGRVTAQHTAALLLSVHATHGSCARGADRSPFRCALPRPIRRVLESRRRVLNCWQSFPDAGSNRNGLVVRHWRLHGRRILAIWYEIWYFLHFFHFVPGTTTAVFFFFFLSSLLLSSSARKRFYPQRPSGQAVVTGVVPFSPRYVPSIFIAHRVQHSHCSSIFIECCQLTLSRFPLINFYARKSPYEYVHSVIIELAILILVGTRITYQVTGDAAV